MNNFQKLHEGLSLSSRIEFSMKALLEYLFILLFAFVCNAGISVSADSSNEAAMPTASFADADAGFSTADIPGFSDGYIPEGISLPVQQLARNGSSNGNMLRLATGQGSASGRIINGGTRHIAFRQYELSSPFYCTPPCKYYVLALRHLII